MTVQEQTFARRPVAKITFEMWCRSCGLNTLHPTTERAQRAALAHIDEWAVGHDALVHDWNGWHRP